MSGWEGLGGPVRMDRPNLEGIDPTLDSCCIREAEGNRRMNALTRTLQRFDVTAERERIRRHLVQTSFFEGCRCCYDPNSDGGEYRALIELKERQQPPHQNAEEEEVEEDRDSDDEFDYLLDEDIPSQSEELRAFEARRRAELEMEVLNREIAVQHGYGVHRQMHPGRVLKAAGLGSSSAACPAVVLHLVDPDSTASATLDLFLETKLAPANPGTKFLRSGGRSTLLLDPELSEKALPRLQPDRDVPAVIAIRDGVVVNHCPNLQGLVDSSGEIVESATIEWLDRSGVLLTSPPMHVCRIRPEEEALMDYLMTMKPAAAEEERFDCGLTGCSKSFPHEHVGEKTTQQDGLVVPEREVISGEIE